MTQGSLISTVAHVVALSGGKDSTAMALRLQELSPEIDFEFVCTPTGDELPEMVEHWAHLQELLSKRLTVISSGQSLGSLIEHWNALPNWRQRWCTRVLKIEPFAAYLATKLPATIYVGIRADEAEDREGVEYGDGVIRRFPLVEWGWGLQEVLGYLDARGVAIPERTDCAACFFQRQGEWWNLWQNYPERYAKAEGWEISTGHTFRSPGPGDSHSSLTVLRERFESGYKPRITKMKDRLLMCGVCAR